MPMRKKDFEAIARAIMPPLEDWRDGEFANHQARAYAIAIRIADHCQTEYAAKGFDRARFLRQCGVEE